MTTVPTPEQELARLRWRCRRGMRELDVLLLRFVEQDYPVAEPAVQEAFEDLLTWQDPQILDLLMGRAVAEDERINDIIRRLLAANQAAT